MKLSHNLARTIELQIKLPTAKYDVDTIRHTMIGSFVEPRPRRGAHAQPILLDSLRKKARGLTGHLCSQLQYLVYATLC
jgi:hypothetical protein